MGFHVRGVGYSPTRRAAKPQPALQQFLSSLASLHGVRWPAAVRELVGRAIVVQKSITRVLSPKQLEIIRSAALQPKLSKLPLSERINKTNVKYPTSAIEMVACNITKWQCKPLSKFQPQLPLF